jgi:hypothetical protein
MQLGQSLRMGILNRILEFEQNRLGDCNMPVGFIRNCSLLTKCSQATRRVLTNFQVATAINQACSWSFWVGFVELDYSFLTLQPAS